MPGEPLRFDDYVNDALYNPTTGFYAATGNAGGARGDFLTSPEVGPLFGAVLARALDSWWSDLGRPDPFPVVEVGSGPGTLMRALVAAEPDCSAVWSLTSVERSARQRSQQADLVGKGVGVTGDLPPLGGAVVVMNELLDNVPFRVVERAEDGWREWYVESGREVLRRPVDLPEWFAAPELDLGVPVPLLEGARELLVDVVARSPARVIAFDYGVLTTEELGRRGGWLRTYVAHRKGSDPLAAAGLTDITTDICVDQLPLGVAVVSQAEFLQRWGIDSLVAEGRDRWRAEASRPTVAALKARSRIREAEALCDPAGLGAFLALEWEAGLA